MAGLQEHTLIYDADCPLCQAYSSAFIQTGFLDKEGRIPFNEMKQEWRNRIDLYRARHEIALLNRKTGEVEYGVNGLVKILGSKICLISFLFKCTLLKQLVKMVYDFISYNRKVIMPFRKDYSKPSCSPDYHHGYRIAYVFFSGFLTALILQWVGGHHAFYLQHVPAYAEFWIVPAQWIFQLLVLKPSTKEEAVTYLGQLQTVSLAAALLLMPMALVSEYLGHAGQGLLVMNFVAAVALLFFWYKRRMNLLHFPKRMTYSWIFFRGVLVVVLYQIGS